MKPITILNASNVPTGPFTRAEVAEKLRQGEFTPESLAHVEGLAAWTPLREVLAKVDAEANLPPPVPPVPRNAPGGVPPGYSYAVTMEPPSHLVYAGFWLRFVAYILDVCIIGLPFGLVFGVALAMLGGFAAATGGLNGGNHDDATNAVFAGGFILVEVAFVVVSTAASWLYFALLESGPHQSTFGKRVMGLKVTDLAGQRVTFGHATGRFFSKIITGLIPLGIGYIMAGFTDRKQALHDLIASTLVVRR